MVEEKLMELQKYQLMKSYILYRYERALIRKANTTDESILSLIKNANKDVMEENSNKNAHTAATQRDLIAGEVSKDLTRRILLPEYLAKAHDEGAIHFHDADYFIQPIFNCCLVNIGDMLDNGTVMNGKMIESPKSFQVACTVVTQIIASVASSQYGGQSVNVAHLGKYLRRTREKYRRQCDEKFGDTISEEEKNEIVEMRLKDELKAGVQTIQYQINTLMTTNGQSPFVTLFMYLDENDPYIEENAMIIEEILRQRYQGIKNEVGVYVTPAFPKLVYVLDENNCLKGGKYDYLTRLAVKCSSKRLYPDYISAKMFLSSINPSMVSTQGTAIGAAINLAARSFTPDETTDKAIILITDGENHEDDAIGAAKAAAEKGIHVNIVGMGDPKGSPIPIQGSNNYMKDKDGNVVITKLNEQMGQEIAAAGNGMYVRADNTNSALKALQKEIEKMNKTELDSKVYSEYDEQFQIFAWIALFLLIADFMTLDRKNRIFRKVKLFSLILFLCAGTVSAQKAERKNVREGNKLYESEKYTESEIAYRKSLEVNPRSTEGTYNLGNSLYKQGKFPEAAEQYQLIAGQGEKMVATPEGKARLSEVYHNMGNIFMQNKDYGKAVEVYKQSLRLNPKDDETRYNLALAQKLLSDQQNQDQSQDQQNDDKQENKEQKDDQQQQQQQQPQDDQKQDKTQEQQQQGEQMSKDNAQQMLDAFLQDEKDTQEKVKKAQMQQQQRRKTEKEW